MKARIEGDTLFVEVPLIDPVLSKEGKTFHRVSPGAVKSGIVIGGQELTINLMAYVRNPDYKK